jgi:DNA-binding IclR family transcriptional regulator
MQNERAPRVRAVPAVTRAIAILRLLSHSRAPMSLKSIADELELVPSTALHIARALVAEKLLQVDPQTKRYRLGVGMLPLARAVLENSDFPTLVRPKLDALSARYGVTAIGVELPDLDNMVVVALSRAGAPACGRRQPLPGVDQRDRPLPCRLQRASREGDREAFPAAALAQRAEL